MSFEITTAFVQQYKNNVELLLQQRGSKLRASVTEAAYVGKSAKAVEQIGKVAAQKVTSRHADTPLISTPHDARWVNPQSYDWADLIDDEDKLRMLIDPTSSYAQNGAFALGRAMDDEIITAFTGTAKTGENGTVNTAFDALNTVAAAASGMTVAKLRSAKQILMENEVDTDSDPLWVGITAEQEFDLLSETQAISLDFTQKPKLDEGKLTSFMGFNFITIQRLVKDGSGNRRCPVWARSGMHMGVWNDISIDIAKRTDKRNSVQVFASGTFGATRIEEGKVAEILCVEV